MRLQSKRLLVFEVNLVEQTYFSYTEKSQVQSVPDDFMDDLTKQKWKRRKLSLSLLAFKNRKSSVFKVRHQFTMLPSQSPPW